IHATSATNTKPQFNSLKDPDGNELLSTLGEFAWKSNGYSNLLVPISSSYDPKPGIWSYSATNYSQLKLDMRTSDLSETPTIKVQPYISGSDNISSALNIMKSIFSTSGINLDLEDTETLESKYSQVSYNFNNSTTSEMVSKGNEDKVNLFFITDYTDAAYLGNAAGIPGSQGLKGSHNGVLINLSAHKTGGSLNNQLLGETAGHEMGHFLGLFHPSESAGTLFDPIADTPQCPLSQNSNNDSKLTAEECGQQYGADNLMFWDSWENGNQDNLTEGQVYVLKRALIAK
ncbi:MAG: hypothetical protein VXW83_06090, partial [SAR324 cluster bacterium]|nr:hypothetical protein [SAR324 cluster bacterium]